MADSPDALRPAEPAPPEATPATRPGLVVTGAAGRMGQRLLRLVAADDRVRLAGALVRPGHPWVGRDAGEAAGLGPLGVPVTDDPLDAFARAQGILDFTTPAASVGYAALAAQARAVHVIGTTGLSAADGRAIEAAARHAVIVRAGNTSLGAHLLAALVRQAARALGPDWDVEIVEMHHRLKADAPSGTALLLGEAAAEGRGGRLADLMDVARGGQRAAGRIGVASLRGGDVVGEHDVILAGEGERVVLRHVATDRDVFARGALRAVLWGQDRAPGAYGMADVLGL